MAKRELKRNRAGQFVKGNTGGGRLHRAKVTKDAVLRALRRKGMDENDWYDFVLKQAYNFNDKTCLDLINGIMFQKYKPEQKPIAFKITGETLVEKAENILDEVARGRLSIENGTQLIRSLKELGSLIEFHELSVKIDQLEEQLRRYHEEAQNREDW
ncbi:hypothetical protein [Microbulbifer taiwanensis]|uniref:Uncharacterized protein n=1 Tax=Microbulbifer taiwanensis TaxID=986746 RepID=A0ABW1YI31_9GAMM|nr:hypothetical protein [Microbulbifer taiwanensis]